MECRKCGKILSEQEKFCTYCGNYYDSSEIDEDLKTVELNSKTDEILDEHNKKLIAEYENKDMFKKKCLKTFLSTDYQNVISSGFNIYALLFSWIYFIYKKMYIIGIIGLLVMGILILYDKIIFFVYAVLSMIMSGLFFNKLYKWKANRIINKILRKNTNPNVILKKIKKAGKENVLLTMAIYFIFLLLLIFTYVFLEKEIGINDKFWKDNSSNKATCLSMITSAKAQSNTNSIATIQDAGCIILDLNKNQFEIYLNFNKNNKTVIEKYKAEAGQMYFIGNTDMLLEYEDNIGNLNEAERNYYQNMLELKNTYLKIKQNAKQEENLIKNNSNITSRKYFMFTKEEIDR